MKKGFSLIEVLISLLILSVVIAGFIAAVVLSVRSFRLSKARYLGTKIAEEGIELVINKRDNNLICAKSDTCSLPCGWKYGLLRNPGGCALIAKSWNVDATKPDRLLAGNLFDDYNSSGKICIKPGFQNKFGICSGAETPIPGNYNREVRVTNADGASFPAVNVRSTVTWKSGGVNYSVILEQILFGLP
ncbi:MAG: prepilin-type N-terminal cleavage/methylation domain-containing protein [bacterium]|nr:prepilin-type N-terminal cleavage/methylation domain-containing protein [bacterium]